jgi:hypothetical protein
MVQQMVVCSLVVPQTTVDVLQTQRVNGGRRDR